jgi:hypothetical protein
MSELVERALKAKRESKRIEFKRGFDTSSPAEWCELITSATKLLLAVQGHCPGFEPYRPPATIISIFYQISH